MKLETGLLRKKKLYHTNMIFVDRRKVKNLFPVLGGGKCVVKFLIFRSKSRSRAVLV
jgi:hypothetical protein